MKYNFKEVLLWKKNYYTEADSAASHKQTAGSTEYFGDRIPPEFQ